VAEPPVFVPVAAPPGIPGGGDALVPVPDRRHSAKGRAKPDHRAGLYPATPSREPGTANSGLQNEPQAGWKRPSSVGNWRINLAERLPPKPVDLAPGGWKMIPAARVKSPGLDLPIVATNDNLPLLVPSRERLEAESVLYIHAVRSRQHLSPSLLVICALCLATLAAFIIFGLDF
jgi:hypothetical protein